MQDFEYFIASDGKKRKGIWIDCKQCNQRHLSRIRRNSKNEFCSGRCARDYIKQNGSVTTICAWCKLEHTKKKSQLVNSKSGLYFCTRKCKDEAQKIGGIKEIQPLHFGTAKDQGSEIYRKLFEDHEFFCNRCGYKEFKVAVQIHHIDENRTNNDKTNLIPLCANCHWALHNNKWGLKEINH